MPYLHENDQHEIAPQRPDRPAMNAGELNFQLTCVIREYLYVHGLKYQTLNDIVGALEGAKIEFQRRVVAPYEDQKREQNGDVYDS